MGKTVQSSAGSATPSARRGLLRLAAVPVTRGATLIAFGVASYVLVFFAAVRLVPLTMGFVKDGTGVTMDMPVETVLAVWIAPSLFLIAVLFALVIHLLRSAWALRRRTIQRVAAWSTAPAELSLNRVTPLAKQDSRARHHRAKTA